MNASRFPRGYVIRTVPSSWRWLGALTVLTLVAACGGGGDTPAAVSPVPTVTLAVTTIAVSYSGASVGVGQTQTVTAEAKDQNGAPMSGVAFTWASSNSNVANVNGGVVTGLAAGTTGITASSGGVTSNTANLTVVVLAKGSVVIDKASVFFSASGQSSALTAQTLDAQGAPSGGAVTWTSSAPDKVSVDATGRLVARAIGSAQVFAESNGARSAPTLVFVAEPQPGALLVTDAQVVSVGSPLGVAAGAAPGIGTQYEVTLQGVAAPAPGTVMLATETAPIAGKVISTRQEAAGLVVTLALVPLNQVFSAYDFDWNIDLSAFALEEPSTPTVSASRSAVWTVAGRDRARAMAVARPLSIVEPFKKFTCDATFGPQLISKTIAVAPALKLFLVVTDRPGYSKHALEGSATVDGSASIKLAAGFNASGKCEAKGQVILPVTGVLKKVIAPAVHVGLGVALAGEVQVVQAELAVTGRSGISPISIGWECGGTSAACRGLDVKTPINEFKTVSTLPTENGMQAKISGHFYLLAGLDLALLDGLGNLGIVEARIGPKQSFDLAFEKDQAARRDYASSYDLKLEGVVEPGPALAAALSLAYGDVTLSAAFSPTFTQDISESPKGNLSVSQTRVAIGKAVDFTVVLDPKTTQYRLLGYNVTGVDIYRKRDDELDFTPWKSMPFTASNQTTFTYHWVTEPADAGKYEFAAFVNTQVLTPWLEIAPNSIQTVEVSCFSAGALAVNARARALSAKGTQVAPAALTCADTWVGTTSSGDAAYGPNQTQATLTLKVDTRVTGNGPGQVFYYAEGTVKVNGRVTDLNGVHCEYLPFEITIDRDTGSNTPGHGAESNQFVVNYGVDPPTAGGSGIVMGTQTVVCPGFTHTVTAGFPFMSGPEVLLDASGLSWGATNQPFYSFQFTRP
jgi:hypothetical protein